MCVCVCVVPAGWVCVILALCCFIFFHVVSFFFIKKPAGRAGAVLGQPDLVHLGQHLKLNPKLSL